MSEAVEQRIRAEIEAAAPAIEILVVEFPGSGKARVFIDHPDGVTLAHCEQVTEILSEIRESYALEVSSPGPERPLVTPAHFKRYEGRTARLKLLSPLPETGAKTVSGEIVEADDETVTVATGDERLSLQYSAIGRANLVPAA
jgi:ribosome maturation factor RimP